MNRDWYLVCLLFLFLGAVPLLPTVFDFVIMPVIMGDEIVRDPVRWWLILAFTALLEGLAVVSLYRHRPNTIEHKTELDKHTLSDHL